VTKKAVCVRASAQVCECASARAGKSVDACARVGVYVCVCPYHFSDVRLACQPHYPGEALSAKRASATLLPQLHRACRAHAPVAAFQEDCVGRTLHAYEADVGSGLAAVSKAASTRFLVSNIRAVSKSCDCSVSAGMSSMGLIIDFTRFQKLKDNAIFVSILVICN
jgi:hypothetical protein